MPLPTRFFKQVLRFQLPGGEIANFGVHWDAVDGGVPTDDILATTLQDKATTYWNALKLYTSTQTSYIGDLVYRLDNQGRSTYLWDHSIAPAPGVGVAAMMPHEVSTVVTIKGNSTSRRARGRYYLPPPDTNRMTASGLYAVAFTTAMANAAQAYLTSQDPPTIWSVIYSRADQELVPVRTCSVGDIPDAQRRRRNGLTETRQSRILEEYGP